MADLSATQMGTASAACRAYLESLFRLAGRGWLSRTSARLLNIMSVFLAKRRPKDAKKLHIMFNRSSFCCMGGRNDPPKQQNEVPL